MDQLTKKWIRGGIFSIMSSPPIPLDQKEVFTEEQTMDTNNKSAGRILRMTIFERSRNVGRYS